jgi:hypothetical protein
MAILVETRSYVERSEGRILPAGTSRVHIDERRAELGLGTNRERNRAVIDTNRRRGHLEREFFDHKTDGSTSGVTEVHYLSQFSDGGRVSFVGQPAGYFEKSGLIVATDIPQEEPEAIEQQRDFLVPTILPTRLPVMTRLAFTGAKLAGLQTAAQTATKGQRSVVIEHLTPEVSLPTNKYPRSVPIPHASFGNVDIDLIDPDRKRIMHLEAEQEALRKMPDLIPLMALHVYTFIDTALKAADFDDGRFAIVPRSSEPYGYDLRLDVPVEELTKPENVLFVAAVLDAQHQGYSTFGNQSSGLLSGSTFYEGEIFDRKRQPASRDIMHLQQDGYLTITKSPIVFSHAGGMEASGVVLQRGPQFDRVHTAEDVELFRKAAGERIETTIDAVVQTTN